jgi:flagellar basal-body rod modification protein FlgD
MQVNAYSSNNAISSTDTLPSESSKILSQQDFLQLLVTQMQNQNPLEPQSDTQMAAEMAQFTSLQQSSSMSSSLAMIQADSLLGSTVNLQVDPKTLANGVVQGVVVKNGTPMILVNDSAYNLNQVISVAPTPVSTSTSTTNN